MTAEQERQAIVDWLFEDAAQTRAEVSRLHKRKKLTPAQTEQWDVLIAMKVGIARCIERRDHHKAAPHDRRPLAKPASIG